VAEEEEEAEELEEDSFLLLLIEDSFLLFLRKSSVDRMSLEFCVMRLRKSSEDRRGRRAPELAVDVVMVVSMRSGTLDHRDIFVISFLLWLGLRKDRIVMEASSDKHRALSEQIEMVQVLAVVVAVLALLMLASVSSSLLTSAMAGRSSCCLLAMAGMSICI